MAKFPGLIVRTVCTLCAGMLLQVSDRVNEFSGLKAQNFTKTENFSRVGVPNSERALIRNGLAYNTKKNIFFQIDNFFEKCFTTDEKYDSHWNKRSIIQFPTGSAAAAAA